LNPCQNLACPEGLEIFIYGYHSIIDIIGCAELAWDGNEVVD
jgi:hypothetical protein